ncbi:MAG: hypothetical protein HYV28_07895 [Ignavibacteriales bacterium]|nr:hypothetical protein [Ignavibacteriales bacterium]
MKIKVKSVLYFFVLLFIFAIMGCDPDPESFIIICNRSQHILGVQIENTCGDSFNNVQVNPMIIPINQKKKYNIWFPENLIKRCEKLTILFYSFQGSSDSIAKVKKPLLVKKLLMTYDRFDSLNKYMEYP